MNPQPHPLALITAAALALCLTGPAVAADAASHAVAKQLESANRLIEKSSAAQRIGASGNSAAQKLQDAARDLYRQAVAAYDKGDNAAAAQLLDDAKKTMFKAVQAAGAGQVATDKLKQDYDARATSVRALLVAQGRVADEKHAGQTENYAHDHVEAMLAEADAIASGGDYKTAKVKLDEAYRELTQSIERMREGETLEHKVEFNTVEDEFNYYWGKTESQMEAITMAAQSVKGTAKEKMVTAFSKEMTAARSKARSLADGGDFAAAISVLEPLFKRAPFQLMSLLR